MLGGTFCLLGRSFVCASAISGLCPPLTFATSSLGHPLRSSVGGFGPLEQYSVVLVMAVLLGTVHRTTIGGPRVRFCPHGPEGI